ncbi:MAG TPA: hypothetical protein VMW52_08875 [Phycisphaerae bacterium]|nr:hypothetical protein [Phycisphaerae bacterium]
MNNRTSTGGARLIGAIKRPSYEGGFGVGAPSLGDMAFAARHGMTGGMGTFSKAGHVGLPEPVTHAKGGTARNWASQKARGAMHNYAKGLEHLYERAKSVGDFDLADEIEDAMREVGYRTRQGQWDWRQGLYFESSLDPGMDAWAAGQ